MTLSKYRAYDVAIGTGTLGRFEERTMPEPTADHLKTRTVLAGAVGNVLEWYDFALLGYFAPVLSPLFFPSAVPLASLLETYGVFALGFLMRPVGGLIFGHLGDRLGRKKALEWCVLLMAIPTTLMGLLPTYDRVGLLAPVLLVVLRLLQGISVGGEYIGSISFLGEHAPPNRRGLLGSWSACSATLGTLAGSGVAALMTGLLPAEDLLAWGWRVPFLCGILAGLVGLWLRMGVAESPRFQEAAAAGEVVKSPVMEALRQDYRAVLATAGLCLMTSIGFYLPWVWLTTWLAKINQPPMNLELALTLNTVAMSTLLVLVPLAGLLSDQVGRKPVLVAGSAVFALLSYPLFVLLGEGTAGVVLGVQLVFAVGTALIGGASPAAFVELFPTRTRFSGIALGYNLTQAVVGGTTPFVATWLIEATGNTRMPAIYLSAAAVVCGLVALSLTERAGQPLR